MKKLISLLLSLSFIACAAVCLTPAAAAEGELVLAEGSHLTLGETYVDGIDGTITVEKLKANFASAVDVAGKADTAAVATDDAVSCGGESLRALIYGDVNRDGKITVTDVTAMLKRLANWDVNVNSDAADVDANGKVNVSDVTKMLKYLANWDDISLGNVRMVYENTALKAENEDSDVSLYFADAMLKLARSNTENTGLKAYKMKLAKNESESCQAFLVSTADKEGLTASLTPFEYEYGGYTLESELFIDFYYRDITVYNHVFGENNYVMDTDYYPDPLLPAANSFELSAGQAQGFMISVTSGKDTPAGMYKAQLCIKDAEGKVIKTANVYAYVWNFTLPDAPYSASAFGLTRRSISIATGLAAEDDETNRAMYAKYYDFLLDYNLTGSGLPYRIWDERSDKYLDDPRVTSICVDCNTGGFVYTDYFGEPIGEVGKQHFDPDVIRSELKLCFDKLREKPEWFAKHYICGVDEPSTPLEVEREGMIHDFIEETVGPDFTLMLCFAQDCTYDQIKGIDAFDYCSQYVDRWCPQSIAFTTRDNKVPDSSSKWYAQRWLDKYGPFLDRYNTERENGKSGWWYICVSPMPPYANYFIYYQGINNRAVLWQQYMFNIDGLLYWDTTYGIENLTKNHYSVPNGGDGHLLYSGRTFGYGPSPLPSWRLIQVRDSFDDFDYMKLAEEKVGRDEVMKIVNKISTQIVPYTEDYSVLESARDALAKILDED